MAYSKKGKGGGPTSKPGKAAGGKKATCPVDSAKMHEWHAAKPAKKGKKGY